MCARARPLGTDVLLLQIRSGKDKGMEVAHDVVEMGSFAPRMFGCVGLLHTASVETLLVAAGIA